MRIRYSTLNGFKTKAKHLRDLLGIESVTASLDALAQLSGYKSYHEVRATPNLQEGTARAPSDVLPQLLALRPGLKPESGLAVLAQLALFPDFEARADKAILEGFPLGPFAPVTPSTISQFFRRFPQHAEGFNTADFAGHFKLTVAEAQSVLNEYADADFVAAAGFDDRGIEAWRLVRDGYFAFGIGQDVARLSKKATQTAEAALVAIAPALAKVGVVEVSLGGRPAFGLPGGGLVVGLRVKHRPFSKIRDGRAVVDVREVLANALDGGYCSILPFNDQAVPERLARRRVLTGPGVGTVLDAAVESVDTNEVLLGEAYRTFDWDGVFKGVNIVTGSYELQGGYNFDIAEFLRREVDRSEVPVKGKQSDFKYPYDTGRVLSEAAPGLGYELKLQRRAAESRYHLDEYPDVVLANVDYYMATGRLLAHVMNLHSRGAYLSNVTPELKCRDAQAAVIARWEVWARKHAEADARKKSRSRSGRVTTPTLTS